jgi:hypothetical protein
MPCWIYRVVPLKVENQHYGPAADEWNACENIEEQAFPSMLICRACCRNFPLFNFCPCQRACTRFFARWNGMPYSGGGSAGTSLAGLPHLRPPAHRSPLQAGLHQLRLLPELRGLPLRGKWFAPRAVIRESILHRCGRRRPHDSRPEAGVTEIRRYDAIARVLLMKPIMYFQTR